MSPGKEQGPVEHSGGKTRQDPGRSTVMCKAGKGVRGPSRNAERNREERGAPGGTSQRLTGTEQSLLAPKIVELDRQSFST